MPIAPAGSKVLVTGASGYIAVHVVHEALKAGFQVVGTVRSNAKGNYLKELFEKKYPGKFSYTIAEDLEAPGAFDEAVKGVQAVLHTASPFHFATEGKALQTLINPAVNGTLSVLNSIKKNGTEVQRVVITSSYAAILDSTRTPPVEYTEKDWNESSPVNSKRDGDAQEPTDAYRASKTLAERAAWDFVAKEKPQWDLATINPPLVLGPILHQVESPEKLNTSVANIWKLIHGEGKTEADLPGAAGAVVDVRDVALAHVQAIKVAEAGGERFAPTIGKWTWQGAVDVIHQAPWIPEESKAKTPKGKPGNTDITQNNLSGAKTEKVLNVKYHNLQSIIEGTVGSLFEYQAREWKGTPALPAVDLDLPPWIPPTQTKHTDLEWAPLHTLDLSRIAGDDDEVPDDVVKDVGDAFRDVGFIYVENHGLSYGDVLRQFAIGQYAFNGVSAEDKQKYKAKILETGSFVGYKEAGHWKIDGVKDRIEQCNFGSQSFQPEVAAATFPPSLQPLIPEILEFARFNHGVIYKKILAVLTKVLNLPKDFFWKISEDPENKGLDLLRYALYHTPDQQDDEKLGGVRLQGHTDFGSVSILWSQPITSLEVLMPDNTWRLVKHRPNALVINLGDAMHFLSGSYLKPTIHRVVAPPADQATFPRLGLFYFALFNRDAALAPALQSEIVKKAYEGKRFWPGKVPTAGEWEQMRVKAYGQGAAKKGDDGNDHEEIGGYSVTHHNGQTVAARRAVKV